MTARDRLTADATASADPDAAAYDRLIAEVRGALETQPDLSGASWARIRSGVDAGSRGRRGAWLWGAGGLLLAGAAAAALVLGSGPSGGPSPAIVDVQVAIDRPAPEAVPPGLPAPAVPAPVAPAGVQGTLAAGRFETHSAAATGQESVRVVAFDRHVLTVAAHTKLQVVSWTPEALVVDIAEGQVHADVRRASASEIFEMRAGDVKVRVVGTAFTVQRDAAGTVEVDVEHGVVAVTPAAGAEVRLTKGQSWRSKPEVAGVLEPSEVAEVPQVAEAPQVGEVPERVAAEPAEESPRSVTPLAPKKKRRSAKKKRRANRDGADRTEIRKVIEIVVPHSEGSADVGTEAKQQLPRSTREALTPAVRLIRSGRCAAALGKLRAVSKHYKGFKATPPRAVLYLMGYCHRKLGRHDTAAAFFDRYRRVGGRSFAVPTGPSDVLPKPRLDQL